MIYLDSCVAIYLIEEIEPFASQLAACITPQSVICISDLVELECLVLPLRDKQAELLASYKSQLADYKYLPLPKVVYQYATELRASHGLKTPDALHLACAKHHGCTEFWTNDERLNVAAHALGLKTIVFK